MAYAVLMSRHVQRQVERIPAPARRRLAALVEQLREGGPVQPGWPNYGKLSPNRYHCHLSHDWVACWYCERQTVRIEVYYVGSRQDAPY